MQECSLSVNEILRLLARFGIPAWGAAFDGPTPMLSGPQDRAQWAEYILERQGAPILSTPVGSDTLLHANPLSRVTQRFGGPFDRLLEWLIPD